MRLTIGEIIQATGGRLVTGSREEEITGVSTDSRTIRRGDLFFALRGEHHDGHAYLGEVFRKGAAASVVERVGAGFKPAPTKNLVCVPNTLRALGDLASAWRRRFSIPVVAVTGSNGKTTTKDMIAKILTSRYRVLKTEGNFNNLIGLPLTLFRLQEGDELAVLEMGMNRPGEIDRLAEIAAPVVGVITNVAPAHLEGLGSVARIARAKAELLRRLPPEGVAILNADDRFFSRLKKAARCRVLGFGVRKKRGTAVSLRSSRLEDLKGVAFSAKVGKKIVAFRMPMVGSQNISNALAALAVGDHFGISPAGLRKGLGKGLTSFRAGSRRMEIVHLPHRIDVIDDCYNANPDSMVAALEFLKEVGRRRGVAVLGEMLELGPFASREHRKVGFRAARSGVGLLFAVGDHAQDLLSGARRAGLSPSAAYAFDSVEEMAEGVASSLRPGDLVLVKGSRGMRMERIVEELKRTVH